MIFSLLCISKKDNNIFEVKVDIQKVALKV